MSDLERYIIIAPPFTLDEYLDNASNERPTGSFQILQNYIPERDILRTREGITSFSHTPSTTDVTDGIS